MKKYLSVFVAFTVLLATLSPMGFLSWALAAETSGLIPCGLDGGMCTICHLLKMTNTVFSFLVRVALGVAVLSAAASGILYITSSGSGRLMEAAKRALKYTLIGFALSLAAWVFINVLAQSLGYKGPNDEWWDLSNIECTWTANVPEGIGGQNMAIAPRLVLRADGFDSLDDDVNVRAILIDEEGEHDVTSQTSFAVGGVPPGLFELAANNNSESASTETDASGAKMSYNLGVTPVQAAEVAIGTGITGTTGTTGITGVGTTGTGNTGLGTGTNVGTGLSGMMGGTQGGTGGMNMLLNFAMLSSLMGTGGNSSSSMMGMIGGLIGLLGGMAANGKGSSGGFLSGNFMNIFTAVMLLVSLFSNLIGDDDNDSSSSDNNDSSTSSADLKVTCLDIRFLDEESDNNDDDDDKVDVIFKVKNIGDDTSEDFDYTIYFDGEVRAEGSFEADLEDGKTQTYRVQPSDDDVDFSNGGLKLPSDDDEVLIKVVIDPEDEKSSYNENDQRKAYFDVDDTSSDRDNKTCEEDDDSDNDNDNDDDDDDCETIYPLDLDDDEKENRVLAVFINQDYGEEDDFIADTEAIAKDIDIAPVDEDHFIFKRSNEKGRNLCEDEYRSAPLKAYLYESNKNSDTCSFKVCEDLSKSQCSNSPYCTWEDGLCEFNWEERPTVYGYVNDPGEMKAYLCMESIKANDVDPQTILAHEFGHAFKHTKFQEEYYITDEDGDYVEAPEGSYQPDENINCYEGSSRTAAYNYFRGLLDDDEKDNYDNSSAPKEGCNFYKEGWWRSIDKGVMSGYKEAKEFGLPTETLFREAIEKFL